MHILTNRDFTKYFFLIDFIFQIYWLFHYRISLISKYFLECMMSDEFTSHFTDTKLNLNESCQEG